MESAGSVGTAAPPGLYPGLAPGMYGDASDVSDQQQALTAGGVRGLVMAMLKKGAAKKSLHGMVTASNQPAYLYMRAMRNVRVNEFSAGSRHHVVAGRNRRWWVWRRLGVYFFTLSAHAGAGVTLFAGYYAAVQCIHRKDSAARANWHNPPTATALLAGALGGAAHAVVVQPLLLLQSGEVNPMLFRLTEAERRWERTLTARGLS